jgi:hypothetical protein
MLPSKKAGIDIWRHLAQRHCAEPDMTRVTLILFGATILAALIFDLQGCAQTFAQSPAIISPEGRFLGNLNANEYDPDSIANPEGIFGSEFSPWSINNPDSLVGSPNYPFSATSPYSVGEPAPWSPWLKPIE